MAERGQQEWQILDFWHACEHLGRMARLLYGEGNECFRECFGRWRGMLRESRSAEVIGELIQLRDGGQYPKLRDDLQGEINYCTANRQRMDYRRYRELGQLRASIKSRRFRSDHQRLLSESPPQENEPLAA